MADDEKDDPDDEPEDDDPDDEPEDDDPDEPDDDEGDEDDEDDERVERLKARVAELESRLAAGGGALYSPAARWAGWILGALVAATSLALIVVLLGGGLTGPCDCPEADDEYGGATPEQQAQLESLLRQHAQDFQACFDEWSETHPSEIRPGWAVMVRLDVRAGEGGAVVDAAASGEGLPEALGRCLEARVLRWRFPAPGPYTLEIPFSVEGNPPEPDRGGAASDGGADARPAADTAPDR